MLTISRVSQTSIDGELGLVDGNTSGRLPLSAKTYGGGDHLVRHNPKRVQLQRVPYASGWQNRHSDLLRYGLVQIEYSCPHDFKWRTLDFTIFTKSSPPLAIGTYLNGQKGRDNGRYRHRPNSLVRLYLNSRRKSARRKGVGFAWRWQSRMIQTMGVI